MLNLPFSYIFFLVLDGYYYFGFWDTRQKLLYVKLIALIALIALVWTTFIINTINTFSNISCIVIISCN